MKRAIAASFGLVLLLAMMATTGCRQESPVASAADKQIRLPLAANVGYRDTVWWTLDRDWAVLKFDRGNYPGVDSVIWIADISTSSAGAPIRMQLYNLTDSVAIAGSEIITTSTKPVMVQSGNVFKSLPDHEITLGYRIRCDSINTYIQCDRAEIFMYRR